MRYTDCAILTALYWLRYTDCAILTANSFWELSTQFLGNHECVKNILTSVIRQLYPFFPLTVVLRADLYMKGSAQSNIGPAVTFHWKQSSLQFVQMCRCFMFVPHLPFYASTPLFSLFPTSNINRQQSHNSDGSNLNSGCNTFVFLQHKPLNYTRSMQQYLCNFLSEEVVCGRIVEYVNLYF